MATISDTIASEEEALKNLGAVKSSYALINLVKQQLENRLLKTGETLNESPASFTNIMLENQGRILGLNFYEQMMYKNEMNPSTAIKLRSLYNKMNSEIATEIFGYPASITFVLGYEYDKLVNLAKQCPNNTLTLNKESTFNLEDQELFVLDHNIDIVVTNPDSKNENIYAIFDTSDKINPNSSLSEVNNRLVKHQVMTSENGKKLFAMFIPTRQMERKENIIEITSDNPDFFISYTDQLYGFEMGYCQNGSSKYIYKPGVAEGNLSASGYNFSVDNNLKRIYFSFNRTPEYWTPNVGDTVKIMVYTTKGTKGNFTIPNIYSQYNKISFIFRQDRNEKAQDYLTQLMPYLSIKDTSAKGGRDEMSFEAIRKHVINRGSNFSILTPNELERYAETKGFYVEKIRHDVRCLEYRALGILRNDKDIISSISSSISFNLDDIPINKEINNRTLSPKTIYEYDGSISKYLKDTPNYQEYYENYILNKGNQYIFPYHIRFINSSIIEATVFDMNIRNDVHIMNFEYFNTRTANESSIQELILERNPITEDPSILPDAKDNRYTKGYFHFSFYVFTSENVIQNILSNPDNPIIKYKCIITDDNKSYLLNSYFDISDVDDENNCILIHAYLKTDDAITDDNRIMGRDYCLSPVPFVTNPIEYYFLHKEIKFSVYCIEKNLNGESISTSYDTVLTEAEKRDLYFVSTVYTSDKIELFKNLSEIFNLPSNLIINQKEYQRYDKDIFDSYEKDEYAYDTNGNLIKQFKEVNVNGTIMNIMVSKVLHKKGSLKYKDNQEMTTESLITPLLILTDKSEEELREIPFLDLCSMINFETGSMTELELANYLNKFLNDGNEYFAKKVTINGIEVSQIVDAEENKVPESKIDELQNILNTYRYKILKHAKGDIIADASLAKSVNYTAIIKKVPLVNRIYAIGDGYKTILNTYDSIISNVQDVQNYRPDGSTICLGIKNTSGPGNYEIYDQTNNTWVDIDNISLNFDIGVKFKEDMITEVNKECEVIKEIIRDFVNEFEEISFGINTIFDKVKESVSSVDYMVLYKINQYPASQVQSIRKKNGASIVSDKLSVKQIVDTTNSDLTTEEISFKPDITIRVIQ